MTFVYELPEKKKIGEYVPADPEGPTVIAYSVSSFMSGGSFV